MRRAGVGCDPTPWPVARSADFGTGPIGQRRSGEAGGEGGARVPSGKSGGRCLQELVRRRRFVIAATVSASARTVLHPTSYRAGCRTRKRSITTLRRASVARSADDAAGTAWKSNASTKAGPTYPVLWKERRCGGVRLQTPRSRPYISSYGGELVARMFLLCPLTYIPARFMNGRQFRAACEASAGS
jgi:hypothetical protein